MEVLPSGTLPLCKGEVKLEEGDNDAPESSNARSPQSSDSATNRGETTLGGEESGELQGNPERNRRSPTERVIRSGWAPSSRNAPTQLRELAAESFIL